VRLTQLSVFQLVGFLVRNRPASHRDGGRSRGDPLRLGCTHQDLHEGSQDEVVSSKPLTFSLHGADEVGECAVEDGVAGE